MMMHSLWTSLSGRFGSYVSCLRQTSRILLSPASSTHYSGFSSLASPICASLSHRVSSHQPILNSLSRSLRPSTSSNVTSSRNITFEYMHRKGLYCKVRKKKQSPLDGNPQLRGVVLKTLVKKPKKPNSANRKCVRLRLTNGKEVTAYVPGEGHNLQEHNVVLVKGGKLQDTPGVKLVCIRGKYDLPHVKKK